MGSAQGSTWESAGPGTTGGGFPPPKTAATPAGFSESPSEVSSFGISGLSSKSVIKGIFIDVEDGSSMEVQYNPETINERNTVKWAEFEIPGMSHPRYQFISGQAREYTITLFFYDKSDVVMSKANWLKSLTYPDYDSSKLTSQPHRFIFKLGTFIKNTFIMKSVNIIWGPLFANDGITPKQAKVDLVMAEWVEEGVSFSNFR